MESIEIGYDRINLPKEFEGVSNKEKFFVAYKDMKNWYGEKNIQEYSKIIITKRENSRVDLERGYFGSVKNRLDFLLFDTIYPEFADIDRTLRTTSDTSIQRGFRQILVDLENKFQDISYEDRELIKKKISTSFLTMVKTKNKSKFDEIFDSIYNEIKDHYGENLHISEGQDITINTPNDNTNVAPTIKKPLSIGEIENMKKIGISKDFSDMEKSILHLIEKNEDLKNLIENSGKDKKYFESYFDGIFHAFAQQISILFEDVELAPETIYQNETIVDIILAYYEDIIKGQEVTEKNLVHAVSQILLQNDEIMSRYVNSEKIENFKGTIDINELKAITLTEQEEKCLSTVKIKNVSYEKLKDQFKMYKYLKGKQKLNELDEDSIMILYALELIFGKNGQIQNRVKLYVAKEQGINLPLFGIGGKRGLDYTTGNIKDINPVAIVENHPKISEFIQGNPNNEELSLDKRKTLFLELKERKANDNEFLDSIKYLNQYGNVDDSKTNGFNAQELQTIEANQKKVEQMINELNEKKSIKEKCCRKSIMVSCFRAISKFFDTVNNNGENFASEFEIDNLNENIGFEDGIITMEGVIGINKNHIKLYYDTKTGTLEFDNFLAYDAENRCYKIGKVNGAREKINIVLPTMKKMEAQANSVNEKLIDKLSLNVTSYEHILGFAMGEHIRLNCFQGFIGVDMEVNKKFVQQINEKNILKQDIIKSIYSKFYDKGQIENIINGNISISETNEPEQFKLIQLISNSIEHYTSVDQLLNTSVDQLLRFRLYINKLDSILTDNELVEKDGLLRYLFADNKVAPNDAIDISKNIMKHENENLTIGSENGVFTDIIQSNSITGSQQLNYYTFLDLLSENKGSNRIINLDEFENVLSIVDKIKSTGTNLLENKRGILRENYRRKVENGEIIDIKNMNKEIAEASDKTRNDLNDLGLDVDMNSIS